MKRLSDGPSVGELRIPVATALRGEVEPLVDGPFGEVGQGSLQVGPHSLDRVEFPRVGGQLVDHQSPASGDQLLHGLAAVSVQVVPDQDDRAVELPVGRRRVIARSPSR